MELTTVQAILQLVRTAFASCRKPDHFTDFRHCNECWEHDELLRSRDVDSLTHRDVGNAGWDPICFISPEGFAYYFPALARLALAETIGTQGWYGPQLLFHLTSEGPRSRFRQHFDQTQRRAVVAALEYILEAQWDLTLHYACDQQLQAAIDIWSEAGSGQSGPPESLPHST